MWTSLFLGMLALLYLGALTALVWSRFSELHHDRLVRVAGIAGTTAASLTFITNLIVLYAPDLYSNDAAFVLLVIMAEFFPVITLAGGILTLLKQRRGPLILGIGLGLWLLNEIIGYIGTVLKVFG